MGHAVGPVLEKLRGFFEREPSVVFAYLFGSMARGEAGRRSDVDVAVYLDPAGDLATELRLEAGLAQALGSDVDLVVLNRAPLWLQFRILGDGLVAFSRDEVRRIRHRAGTESRFLDFQPVHDAYLAKVRERARKRLS